MLSLRSMRVAVVILSLCISMGIAAPSSFAQESPAGGEKIVVDGSTTVGPIVKAFAEYYMEKNPGVNITVSESGSGNGAKSLMNKTCDVAAMSRFMKDTEYKGAVENGVLPLGHVIAYDGVAAIVHPSNPVKGLTLQQIRDIYTGKINSWKAVGGPDLPIVVISRDTNSGTYETFEGLVMNKEKMVDTVEYVGSNGASRSRVQSTPAAIAYVGVGFLEGVKALEVNGILPDKVTISTGRYPVSRPLFLFTNDFPKMGSHLFSFVTMYVSEKGQEIVEGAGFVPVTSY